MKLRVVHRTTYTYAEPVVASHHLAHLAPRDGDGHRALAHDVSIRPAPAARRERADYFGNLALHFSLTGAHRALEVIATSLVEPAPAPEPATSPPWETARDRVRAERSAFLEPLGFTFDSPLAPALAVARQYAAPSFAPGRPLFEAARDLTRRIHADFAYDTDATDVNTPVVEVLRRRRGVCQDFAHVQIACLRALGLSARYVSGYLLTRPPPGRPRLVGADASHAWVSVFAPGLGWLELDPTNDRLPGDDYVTVAYGRDFADVTPLKGVIAGGGRHELRVAVDVAPDE